MSPERLKALFKARQDTVAELRALDEKASGREYTAEEKATEERMQADITRLGTEIERGLDELEREERAAESMDRYERLLGQATGRAVEQRDENKADVELRSFLTPGGPRSFEARLDPAERRAVMTRLAAKQMGYEARALGLTTVPQPASFVGQLYETLVDLSSIRQANPTVLTTGSGEPLTWPRSTAEGVATWLAEGVGLTESDPTLGSVTLNAHKLGKLVKVNSEALQDQGFDILGYVAGHAARNIAIATDAEYVNGTTPTTRPEGLIPAATIGFTQPTGNTTAFTTANAQDFIHEVWSSLPVPYRARSSWMARDDTLKRIRMLKDTTGQYLWQPGLALGTPDTILGRPVFPDPNVPSAVGANNKVLVVGDFAGYVIRDVGSVRFERSDDAFFANDQVAFRAIWRTDGIMIDASAFRLLANSAT